MNTELVDFLSSFGGNTEKNGPSVANLSTQIRLKFLRKVYSILAVQLTLNTLVSGAILFIPSIKDFTMSNVWMFYLNIGLTVILALALAWKRKDFPTNFILLAAYTLCNSFAIGILVSFYEKMVVLQAFMLTAGITIGLTIYTMTTKNDFSWLGATLTSLIGASLIAGLAQIFLRSPLLETGLSLFGAALFSLFIIYDTQLVMNHISPEDYIIAVLNLYLDIINLFIKILRLLGESKKNNENNNRNNKKSDN